MKAQPSPKIRQGRWGFLARAGALWGATLALCCLTMGTATAQYHVRPDGTPDVLIMVFDGQNCTWATNPGHWSLLCDAKDNFDGMSNRPGYQAMAELLQQRGYSVEIRGYAGKFQGGVSSITKRYERGLEDALHDLDNARGQWIAGYLNPTRLIVTGASAGGIWAHLAILANPDLTFDYLIDSDSACLYWARNYQSFQRAVGRNTPSGAYIRAKLSHIDLERLCTPGTRPSRDGSWLRITNLVPSNVLVNLEAQTRLWGGQNRQPDETTPNVPNDYVINRRINGSRQGIYTVLDLVDMHGDVFMPGHAATQWMLDMIDVLGMPPSPLIAGSQEIVRRGRLSLPGKGLFDNLPGFNVVPAGKVEPDSALWTLEP
jgi:hypothetical protein